MQTCLKILQRPNPLKMSPLSGSKKEICKSVAISRFDELVNPDGLEIGENFAKSRSSPDVTSVVPPYWVELPVIPRDDQWSPRRNTSQNGAQRILYRMGAKNLKFNVDSPTNSPLFQRIFLGESERSFPLHGHFSSH